MLSLREQPYVESAIAVGTTRPMIMIRHILPGVVPPLIVQATFIWATAMILEAALSFIGAGTPPSTPSWGNLLADARALWQIRPTLVFFPAGFLVVTLLAVNMLGDGLRDISIRVKAGGLARRLATILQGRFHEVAFRP